MGLMHWLRGIAYSGYDRHGKLKYLSGRPDDPGVWSAQPRPVGPGPLGEALRCATRSTSPKARSFACAPTTN